jgi:hypothetical protein
MKQQQFNQECIGELGDLPGIFFPLVCETFLSGTADGLMRFLAGEKSKAYLLFPKQYPKNQKQHAIQHFSSN